MSNFEIHSEEDLIEVFRPRDRKHVFLPQNLHFPILIRSYMTWTEPSGVRVYLVFKKPEWNHALGIAFRRDQQGSLPSPTGMCDWCLDYGPSDKIGLLTATVTHKKRIGVNLCLDLSCIRKLETTANLTGQDFDKLVTKLLDKMERFYNDGLQVDDGDIYLV